MSVGPRFVFTRFAPLTTPRLAQWVDHLARITGTRPPLAGAPDDDDTVVVWSLVSGNNRELARGYRVYSRFDDATRAAAASAEATGWQPHLVNDARAGGYGWYLALDGVPDVVGARWYESDRDRRAALRGALDALPLAVSSPGSRAAALGVVG